MLDAEGEGVTDREVEEEELHRQGKPGEAAPPPGPWATRLTGLREALLLSTPTPGSTEGTPEISFLMLVFLF